jgi:hypothetical protein
MLLAIVRASMFDEAKIATVKYDCGNFRDETSDGLAPKPAAGR